jgi:hypothetical protein
MVTEPPEAGGLDSAGLDAAGGVVVSFDPPPEEHPTAIRATTRTAANLFDMLNLLPRCWPPRQQGKYAATEAGNGVRLIRREE